MKEPPSQSIVKSWIKKILDVPEYIDGMDLIQLKEVLIQLKRSEKGVSRSQYFLNQEKDKFYYVKGLVALKIALLGEPATKTVIISETPSDRKTFEINPKKKLPSKYYALLHWIKIEIGKEQNFNKDGNGDFKKNQIQEYAAKSFPDISSQGFYRAFIEFASSDKKSIVNGFEPGFKKSIAELSGNDASVIHHLKSYPD